MHFEHVTIRTRNLAESIAFYEAVVGLKLLRDMRPHAPIVFMADEEGGTQVELMADQASFTREGISLGFRTEDVAGKRAELAEKGLHPTPIISPNSYTSFFFITDPNGVEIQFIN